jgi:hypothetical protein
VSGRAPAAFQASDEDALAGSLRRSELRRLARGWGAYVSFLCTLSSDETQHNSSLPADLVRRGRARCGPRRLLLGGVERALDRPAHERPGHPGAHEDTTATGAPTNRWPG